MPMNPSWRRTTLEALHHIECELQRLSISSSPISTTRTSQGHTKTIYGHSMFWSKADKLHDHLNTGYNYVQWKQCHTIGGLVSGH